MISDTQLRQNGFMFLVKKFGPVDAERFVSLIIKDPFDYTKWQKNLFAKESVSSLSKKAMKAAKGK